MSNSDADSSAPKTGVVGHRRLQKFGSPDLEVAVGEKEQLFHYHSLILADQSLYVDTLLSSPAARKEQEKMRISFPEIEVEMWERMMKFLKPSAVQPTLDELKEIIPLYDKYQFNDGLDYCDDVLSRLIPKRKDWYWSQDHEHTVALARGISQLVSIIWPLNSFRLSKPLALDWAIWCFKRLQFVDEEMLRFLMPLVENNDDAMHSAVSVFLGRRSKGMAMNEMRDLTKQPDFPEECIFRCRQLRHLDDQLDHLKVDKLSIKGAGEEVDGEYQFETPPESLSSDSHHCGVAKGFWKKELPRNLFHEEGDDEAPNETTFTVASVDYFGNAWEVRKETSSNDGFEERDVTVLYQWENGVFNSLVPPQCGWKRIDDNGVAVAAKKMWLDYYIHHRRY